MSAAAGAGRLTILAVSATWQGANDYALVRAFRRAGHSVSVVSADEFIPAGWTRTSLRALRRLLEPALVDEYNRALMAAARAIQPDLFFVFKGPHVRRATVEEIGRGGATTIQFYPDVSVFAHGPYLPEALPAYDWVFTTKSFGVEDMRARLGVTRASFTPHGFDPETHRPEPLTEAERARYGCDVGFIGTWSPKKEALIRALSRDAPEAQVRIWGAGWERAGDIAPAEIAGRGVFGAEYAKAIGAAAINLGLLSEAREGASTGDQTTARTFEIPATGGFMLHERTAEALSFFREDTECAYFDGAQDIGAQVRRFLPLAQERAAIAAAGRARALASAYSADDRIASIVAKHWELRAAHSRTSSGLSHP